MESVFVVRPHLLFLLCVFASLRETLCARPFVSYKAHAGFYGLTPIAILCRRCAADRRDVTSSRFRRYVGGT